MDKKTKVQLGIVVVVVGVAVWAGMSMMGGDDAAQIAEVKQQTRPNTDIPKPAALVTKSGEPVAAPSDRERMLVKMQQDTETKYIATLEQLQLLLVEKDIANANKDISKANEESAKSKLTMVTAQKRLVETMAAPKPTTPATVDNAGSVGAPPSGGKGAAAGAGSSSNTAEVYAVVSVSYTRGKWVAVLSSNTGKLYSVSVGDPLVEDGSTVKSIGRSGVTLEMAGTSRKIPMVSVI